jgi:hypothetical protein
LRTDTAGGLPHAVSVIMKFGRLIAAAALVVAAFVIFIDVQDNINAHSPKRGLDESTRGMKYLKAEKGGAYNAVRKEHKKTPPLIEDTLHDKAPEVGDKDYPKTSLDESKKKPSKKKKKRKKNMKAAQEPANTPSPPPTQVIEMEVPALPPPSTAEVASNTKSKYGFWEKGRALLACAHLTHTHPCP